MLLKIKRKDLKILLDGGIFNSDIYYAINQAADKLRAIYVMFGWKHMLKDMETVDNSLFNLVNSCVKSMVDNPKQGNASASSAGIRVDMFECDDEIELSVCFNIL